MCAGNKNIRFTASWLKQKDFYAVQPHHTVIILHNSGKVINENLPAIIHPYIFHVKSGVNKKGLTLHYV
jgi:hypothetical protein